MTDRLQAELSQLRVELRRIKTTDLRSGLTGAQADINSLESDVAALPQGVLGYAQVTADQPSISTLVDLTGLSVTVTVGTGRRIKITGFAHFISKSSEDERARLRIRTGGGSTLNFANSGYMVEGVDDKGEQVTVFAVVTPSAGSQTFKLSAEKITGASDIEMDASSSHPAFILVEDLGPA